MPISNDALLSPLNIERMPACDERLGWQAEHIGRQRGGGSTAPRLRNRFGSSRDRVAHREAQNTSPGRA
jgi:hypothetical protein